MTTSVNFFTFVERARIVHGDKYLYSEVTYKNITTKISIMCSVHGWFTQCPVNHLRGQGCPSCKFIKLSSIYKKPLDLFIEQASKKHNDFYDYSKSVYVNSRIKIEIICPIHGSFWQLPTNHLSKSRGCPKCKGGVALTQKEFVLKATRRFNNKFSYSNTHYINATTKIEVICPIHGNFFTKPAVHLHSRYGCRQCFLQDFDNGVSKVGTEWLDNLEIDLLKEFEITVNGRKFIVDGYDPKTNTIYEYYGKFWHGHPSIYPPEEYNKVNKIKYGELYRQTLQRQDLLKAAGYSFVIKWGL